MPLQLTPINELTNKAVLGIATAIGAGLLAIIGTAFIAGAKAVMDSRYATKLEVVDSQIEFYNRRIYEIDEIFITVDDLDRITATRLGVDRGWYITQRDVVLRKRGDIDEH